MRSYINGNWEDIWISEKNCTILFVKIIAYYVSVLILTRKRCQIFLFETSKKPLFDFNKSIINATKDLVCAYKLNMAFYEVFGKEGYELLEKTIE
ncbi:hypothetical protein MBGDC06_00638, partial [Thermoplasmatales archaeon SCGC AB-539-C06]